MADLLESTTIGGKLVSSSIEDLEGKLEGNFGYVRYLGSTAGSGNAYTIAVTPAVPVYADGVGYSFKANRTSTGLVTLNISSRGAKPIYNSKGVQLKAGDITNGSVYTVRYNGTNFILQGEGGGTGNAQPNQVEEGATFTNNNGEQVGTLEKPLWVYPSNATSIGNNGTIRLQGFPNAIIDAETLMEITDQNFKPENIKEGISIWDKQGVYKGNGGNARPEDVLLGKTFSNDDGEQTGVLEFIGRSVDTATTRSISSFIGLSVAYGNGLYVIVSSNNSPGRIATSPDGITWTLREMSQISRWQSVTYGNGLFVAVASIGTSRIMTSPDGINWTFRTAPEENQWMAVTYGKGMFVAVADSGMNRVMTSTNGITWTVRQAPASSWSSVTYSDDLDMFVAVAMGGTDRIMTSTNGTSWTGRTAPQTNPWQSVTYGNGNFVAVASSGTNRAMYSNNGTSWALGNIGTRSYFAVTFGDGVFVAVGQNGSVMRSINGVTWTESTISGGQSWNAVTYGEDQRAFVAITNTDDNRGTARLDLLGKLVVQ